MGQGPKRRKSTRPGISFETVRGIALALPGVEEGMSYGTPAFRVKGKFMLRLKEDGETVAVKCGFDERDFRMKADPTTFFTTDHYLGYPTVLVRLATVRLTDLQEVVEQAWRINAPKRLLARYSPAPSDHDAGGKARR